MRLKLNPFEETMSNNIALVLKLTIFKEIDQNE